MTEINNASNINNYYGKVIFIGDILTIKNIISLYIYVCIYVLGVGFNSIDGINGENFAIDLIARLLQWYIYMILEYALFIRIYFLQSSLSVN